MTDDKFISYAKINLCLSVGRRLPDGYHEIRSLMQPIGLCDYITITKRPEGIQVWTNVDELNEEIETNTARRAAVLFFEYTKINSGVEIFIEKHIPYKAGLGGSSSNAACVLNALDKMYATGLSEAEKYFLAVQIGADVPFFIGNTTAFIKGIGEQIEHVCPLPACDVLVVMPDFGVSTKMAYEAIDRCRSASEAQVEKLHTAYLNKDIPAIRAYTSNVFELIMGNFEIITEIKEALLKSGASAASLTGSGSAVFGVFLEGGIDQAYDTLKRQFDRIYRTSFVV